MNIPIVYEDEWLSVLNKPAGLLVIPTPKKEKRTLTSILNDDLKIRDLTYRLHPCHRLDKETSGLIIYAKGKSIQKIMLQEFKQRKIKKRYRKYNFKSASSCWNRISRISCQGYWSFNKKR